MILSFPGEELDDLFMNTLFILPGVIAERSKDIIFLGQEMALLRQSIGRGLDSQGCYIGS